MVPSWKGWKSWESGEGGVLEDMVGNGDGGRNQASRLRLGSEVVVKLEVRIGIFLMTVDNYKRAGE